MLRRLLDRLVDERKAFVSAFDEWLEQRPTIRCERCKKGKLSWHAQQMWKHQPMGLDQPCCSTCRNEQWCGRRDRSGSPPPPVLAAPSCDLSEWSLCGSAKTLVRHVSGIVLVIEEHEGFLAGRIVVKEDAEKAMKADVRNILVWAVRAHQALIAEQDDCRVG